MLTSEMTKILNELNPNYDFEAAMGDTYNLIGYVKLHNPSIIKLPKGWSLDKKEQNVISNLTQSFVLMAL